MVLPAPPDVLETLDLVERLQAGHETAWDQLYGRYRDELLLAVRAGMGPRLRAALQSEDVLQSVALDAFRAMPRFVARESGGLRAFLYRLVRSKLVDHARALGAHKRSGAVPLTPTQIEQVPGPQTEPTYRDPRYLQLERALLRLPADMRDVVRLRRFDGLSSKETAQALGKSDDAARKLYSRALARLSLLVGAAEA